MGHIQLAMSLWVASMMGNEAFLSDGLHSVRFGQCFGPLVMKLQAFLANFFIEVFGECSAPDGKLTVLGGSRNVESDELWPKPPVFGSGRMLNRKRFPKGVFNGFAICQILKVLKFDGPVVATKGLHVKNVYFTSSWLCTNISQILCQPTINLLLTSKIGIQLDVFKERAYLVSLAFCVTGDVSVRRRIRWRTWYFALRKAGNGKGVSSLIRKDRNPFILR